MARVAIARDNPTPAQRAERERTAKRKLEAEVEARAELLRRKARQRTAERDEDRARRRYPAPVQAVLQEATRRGEGAIAAPGTAGGGGTSGIATGMGLVPAVPGATQGRGKRAAEGTSDALHAALGSGLPDR